MPNYKIILKLVFLSCLTSANPASAHILEGTLGKTTTGAAATDVYYVSCLNEDLSGEPAVAHHLTVSVKDLAPILASTISIQVTKNNKTSTLSEDTIDGDAKYSPTLSLAAGAGTYLLIINKSLSTIKGIEKYFIQLHCESAINGHTATFSQMIQNN
jgi:hypothetical protein